ncbi:methyl-accepting chemotaxis protein [Paenibacillus qinlingensis]|uniref:Methyl-accepting chemotaxis protein n=1 Tax=Paenibacillus qinlingensis TaxID=1837343 RepID=A0ABU1NVA1_9BACL|nr:methyl-accepting chemotaxis protein [Paenibacillus qinlingensis]MDR6551401.1 methyl-accepting chemotaxis protein [Paenibacillus qinlingensis]
MKIRIKLFLSFTVIVILLIALSLFTTNYLTRTSSSYEEMLQDGDFHYDLRTIQFSLTGRSNDERAYLLNKDEQFPIAMADKDKQIRELFTKIKSYPTLDSDDIDGVNSIIKLYEDYFGLSQQVLTAVKTGKADSAMKLHFNEERDIRNQLDTLTIEVLQKLENEIHSDKVDRKAEAERQNTLMLMIVIAAVIIAVVIGLVLIRSITRPLRAIHRQMQEIAQGDGDLSREIVITSRDEIAEVATSFNQMVSKLRQILSQSMDTAVQVAASSEQLSASSEQTTKATAQIVEATLVISASAEKEQQHMEEAIEAIQQMTAGIEQVTVGNVEVSRLTQSAADASKQGAIAVSAVLSEMEEINETVQHASANIQSLGEQSQQISGIVNMIKDLASRTNMLALNASIEAARAGEHGRGFAVVAQEVRKLAEQSGQSALQIAELIEEIVLRTNNAVVSMDSVSNKVSTGLEKTTQVDEVFHTIEATVSAVFSQVKQTTITTEELAASSKQVVALAETVSVASDQVVAFCQNNAASTEEQLATMEEITSSSVALSRLADDLHGVLSRFKLN